MQLYKNKIKFEIMKLFKNILKYASLIAYVITIILLCALSLKSGESSQEESNAFIDILNNLALYRFLLNVIPELNSFIRKLFGHYGIYAFLGVLGFIVYYSFIKNKIKATSINLATGLFWSLITEFLQLFSQGRGPSVIDGLVNFGGYVSAYCLMYIIWYIINKRKNKADNDFLNSAKILYSISSFLAIVSWVIETTLDQRFCFAIMTVIVAISVIIYAVLMMLPANNRVKLHKE